MTSVDVCPLVPASSLTDDRFDSLIVLSDNFDRLSGAYASLKKPLEDYAQVLVHTSNIDLMIQKYLSCV